MLLGFPPGIVFDRLYSQAIRECGQILRLPNLMQTVRQTFITLASERRRLDLNAVDIHLSRIRGARKLMDRTIRGICSVCIIREPENVLECGHCLCETCLVCLGSPVEPCKYGLHFCPVCNSQNNTIFLVRPPTAAVRALSLSGMNPRLILQFLWELRQQIGLNTMAFKEHFDRFIGYDMGLSSLKSARPTLANQ